MMLRHLAWKDGMTIKPLLGAILIGIVGIFAMLMLIGAVLPTFDSTNVFVSFWVLMPNLVALGAPALLVGSEEESGTLQWLRTLPVKWQQVADSKFLVSMAALAIAWAVSSAAMLIARSTVATNLTPYAESMYSIPGAGHLAFFSVMLLICGFITAYLFRSPIAGLIAVIPLIGFVSFFTSLTGRWLLAGQFAYPGSMVNPTPERYVGVVAAGLTALAIGWLVQRLIAGRRLTKPEGNITVQSITEHDATSAYRPPLIVSTRRPSEFSALLWQQRRQAGKFILGMAVVIAACVLVYYLDRSRSGRSTPFTEFCPLIIAIASTWLGGMAFYGDNVNQRRAFFADRGIKPSRVWWTRMLLPGGVCLALIAFCLFMALYRPQYSRGSVSTIALMILTCFSVGQLVGQWMKRPILTFFAAPAYAAILGISLIVLYSLYQNYAPTAVFIAPILLFASWRLAGSWLAGKVDGKYHWRAIGYMGMAALAPMLVIFGSRVWTTPAAMPAWRSQTLALAAQLPESPIQDELVVPGTFNRTGFSGAFAKLNEEEQTDWLKEELESNTIGEKVSLDDLNLVLSDRVYHNTTEKLLALEILLKWAKQLRESVAAGESTVAMLRDAELAEEAAVQHLELETARGRVPIERKAKIRELIAMIPSRELRKESRKNGLLTDWRQYTSSPWIKENQAGEYFSKYFLMQPVAYTLSDIPFERRRADRYVDDLTRLLLEQLDQGLPQDEQATGYRERQTLWIQLMPPHYRATHVMAMTRTWLASYEDKIRRLRSAVSLPNP